MTGPGGVATTRIWVSIFLRVAVVASMATLLGTISTVSTVGAGPDLPAWTWVAFVVIVATSGWLGVLLIARLPRNPVGWLLWGWAVMIGLSVASMLWVQNGIGRGEADPALTAIAWFASWSYSTTVATFFVPLPLLFPDGRLPSARWRPVAAGLGAVVLFVVTLPFAFGPGPLNIAPEIANPVGLPLLEPMLPLLLEASELAHLLILPVMVLAPIHRYLTGNAVIRQQLKWFAWAIGIAMGSILVAFAAPTGPLSDWAWVTSMTAMGLLVPAAITLAILRHRLYDIDRIISRTIAYGLITAVLFVVFTGGNLLVQTVLQSVVTGNTISVAISTLLVATLFQPVRRRVQHVVDRRFDRARVDAQRVIDAFAVRVRDDVHLGSLDGALVRAVAQTLAPTTIQLWLRDAPPDPEGAK